MEILQHLKYHLTFTGNVKQIYKIVHVQNICIEFDNDNDDNKALVNKSPGTEERSQRSARKLRWRCVNYRGYLTVPLTFKLY